MGNHPIKINWMMIPIDKGKFTILAIIELKATFKSSTEIVYRDYNLCVNLLGR